VGIEDNAGSVAWQVDRLKAELAGVPAVVREQDEAGPLWSALNEYPAAEVGPVTLVANIRPSCVAELIREFDPGRWAVQAHAGNGILRAHALGAPGLDDLAPEIDRLRALAVRDGGNLVLSRCPTDWKERLRVWGEPRPDWALCRRIKQALDPPAAMNPGRFVDGI
jgi:glycolate oxidase FAD binding subunit